MNQTVQEWDPPLSFPSFLRDLFRSIKQYRILLSIVCVLVPCSILYVHYSHESLFELQAEVHVGTVYDFDLGGTALKNILEDAEKIGERLQIQGLKISRTNVNFPKLHLVQGKPLNERGAIDLEGNHTVRLVARGKEAGALKPYLQNLLAPLLGEHEVRFLQIQTSDRSIRDFYKNNTGPRPSRTFVRYASPVEVMPVRSGLLLQAFLSSAIVLIILFLGFCLWRMYRFANAA